jgi:NitT/TauT family transport system substrate-binding protein
MLRARLRRTVLATVLVLSMVGCSAIGGDEQPVQQGGGLEKSKVTVGVLPVVDTASIHIALQRNYFKDEGLEVELKTLAGGAAAVPGLANGELQFAFGNYVSFFNAQAKGALDVKFVADAYQATLGMFLIMVAKDSKIKQSGDLAGRKIAINTRANIVELTARSSLQASGVEPSSVTFVEVPFPDMQAALQRGNVDAAFMVEPYITQSGRLAGMTSILDAASGPTQDMPIAAWATSSKFAQENPRTAAAFQRAINKGQQEASTDRRLVEKTVAGYAKVDEQTASLMRLGTWPTTLSPVRMRRVLDLMKSYGTLDKQLSPESMIFTGAATS